MSEDSKNSSDRNTKNLLEWIVFGISTLLVIAALAFLTYTAAFGDDRPADLHIGIQNSESRSSSTVVTLLIKNTGSKTASEVTVEVIARYGDEEKISAVVIDFVPKGGEREAIVVFPGKVKPDEILPRIQGYVEP